MPNLMIDIPGGFGKVPIFPNPIIDENESHVYLKGFNGEIASYPKF